MDMNIDAAIAELELQLEEVRCWLDAATDASNNVWFSVLDWTVMLSQEIARYRLARWDARP